MAQKSVRVIAYNAALVGLRRTVNIRTTALVAPNDAAREQATWVQVTAAQALANPNVFETVMDANAAPTIAPLTWVVIVGYTAPN